MSCLPPPRSVFHSELCSEGGQRHRCVENTCARPIVGAQHTVIVFDSGCSCLRPCVYVKWMKVPIEPVSKAELMMTVDRAPPVLFLYKVGDVTIQPGLGENCLVL